MSRQNSGRGRGLLPLLAYFSVVFLGVALLLAWLFGRFDATMALANALSIISTLLAIIVTAVFGFFYAFGGTGKTRIWWIIAWVVAVVLIIVFYSLGL